MPLGMARKNGEIYRRKPIGARACYYVKAETIRYSGDRVSEAGLIPPAGKEKTVAASCRTDTLLIWLT